jgi:alpha-L-rhamnosidase
MHTRGPLDRSLTGTCALVAWTGLSVLSPGPSAWTRDAGRGLVPSGLRCEYSIDPLGIDRPHPRLFWKVASRERDQRQAAYRIVVASSADLLARHEGDLWDTGRVASDETTHIPYQGRALTSSQQAFWKVRVWDQDGAASEWSAPARWTMGLLAADDWQGIWIGAPAATETLLLRKELTVRPGLVRAIAHVCGLGQYEMTLNGVKAGEDLLSPGWTDYDETTLYDTRDVTGLLREGPNAIGLALGNGMYNVVRRNRFAKFTGSFGPLRAIAHLRLEYADGAMQVVSSDDTWRTQAGPVTYSSAFGGEDYDARLAPHGWDVAGFDDRAWRPAVPIIRLPATLRGHSAAAEPLRAIGVLSPVAQRALAEPGVVVYDLGQNASYMPRLRVQGPAGSSVRLTPAELVNEDGTLDRGSVGGAHRGAAWWQYTKASDAEETWFPQFYYSGFRYLEARLQPATPLGALPSIESLEGVIVHSSAAPIGEFACSNELLNRIRRLVRWAQRSNMVSILTDCPHREKLGWLEQYHLNGPAVRYEFDLARLFTKGMHDMADAQLEDGLVPNIAPEYAQFEGAFRAASEWGSAFIIVPWQQYQSLGDLDLLRSHYEAMKRYFAYLEGRARDDVVSEGLGDWYDLGPQKPGTAQLTPPPITATAFYYQDAWILSQAAALLGRPDEGQDYAARAARIRASFNRHFFNREAGSYGSGSQCANALALVLGIVEPGDRAAVLASLVRDLESRDHAMTAGDVGFRFLLQALALGGRSDAVYRMINQDERPGYGYQLKKGATSLTESWDANRSSSQNHFMLGHITEWFYKDLAGIDSDPAGPGFKRIIFKPNPVGDLAWARASYETLHGTVSSHWMRDGGRFTLTVEIPANTTATVFVPARTPADVTVGGRPLTRARGVRFLRMEDGRAVLAAGSGTYRFESRR